MTRALNKLEARYHRALRHVPNWVVELTGLLLLSGLMFVIACGLVLGRLPW